MPHKNAIGSPACSVSITRSGIRDIKRKCNYTAPWMSGMHGRRVHVYGDLFGDGVLVYNAETGELLGAAETMVPLRGRMFKRGDKLYVKGVRNVT